MGADNIALTLAGIEIVAVSIGGMETCIEIPEWQLCFDIGRCPPTAVKRKRVCFTHAHVDHMGGVAHHIGLRALLGMPPPTYHLPAQAAPAFADLLAAWRALDASDLPVDVAPVSPGDVVEVGKNRRIRVFKSHHRVPTVGYGLERTIHRLLPELEGLPSDQIAARRAAGAPVTSAEICLEVVFCGDTRIDVVDHEPLVRRAKVLILECTFVPPVSIEHARRTGHVHLDEIAERADLFENEAILLTHFSKRHSPSEIRDAIGRALPEGLRKRVTPLLPPR